MYTAWNCIQSSSMREVSLHIAAGRVGNLTKCLIVWAVSE